MRVPLGWLAELVDLPASPATLADRLTLAGLGVERVEEVGDVHREVRVGTLLAVEPHPQAERLQVCRVDVAGPPITVVSGAPGLAPGQRVAVALPGAVLADGRSVASVELRGVASQGVLCSAAELGLFDETDRVLVVDDGAIPGTAVAALPGVRDVVLEIEVTANRGDCLSILGIAREVAALTGVRLRVPRPRLREAGTAAADAVRVRIDAPELCGRYAARVVRGVGIGQSSFAVRLRLSRAGMRPISNVVDATNLVMLEIGQPLHAFDLARVGGGQIVVRRAAAGERLVTLDGAERTLVPDDLVIADAEQPVALAGVMGGQASEVSPATRDLLLESAWFAPSAVRRTSRRLGVPSQAAYRFERRVDPAAAPLALDAVAALIARLAGGTVAPGAVEDAPGLAALAPAPVRVRPARVAELVGMPIARRAMVGALRGLGATVASEGASLLVTPPSWRGDLAIEEDVVEEIARVVGYEAVPTTLPLAPTTPGHDAPERRTVRRLRRLLVAEGLTEMVTLAFTDAATNARLPGAVGASLAPIALVNPLSAEAAELRRSPLAGLVRAATLNLAYGADGVAAFELAKAYGRDADGVPQEPRVVAIALCGCWPPRGVERGGPPTDFWDVKGVVENLLAALGTGDDDVRWTPLADVAWLHPGKSAAITVAGRPLGVAGALHPEVAQACDFTRELWVAELDFATLATLEAARVAVRPLPRFPAVTRDIAVVVDDDFPAEQILVEIRALHDPLIESASIFDCYRGAPIPDGRKSLAYSIAYRAADRTLTDDEVNRVHGQVREHLRARFALELRS